jgi:Cd2+/Zn2+-exporting ATPase
MEQKTEMDFTLDGLCCPVCAAKIEKGIRGLEGVRDARINFSTRQLSVEIGSRTEAEGIIVRAGALVKQIESGIRMIRGGAAGLPAESGAPEAPPAAAGKTAETPASEGAREGEKSPRRDEKKRFYRVLFPALGAALFAAGLVFDFSGIVFRAGGLELNAEFIVFLAAYLLAGGEIIFHALSNISRGQVFDENFLMTIASAGAFVIGEYPEGVAVMLFYQAGEAFQRMAIDRSRRSISTLMDIRPDFAFVKRNGEVLRVSPEAVQIGESIVVKPGEKIPLDGIVSEGRSALDTSALTGESLPRDVEPGSEVLSGSINKSGLLTVTVTKEFGESTVSKILNLVQNAGSKKAPIENFITKFARYYTPAVVLAALALAVIPPLVLPGAVFADWLRRALVFLVVSCPCALVVSIPLGFFGGIGAASRKGILVKGGNYLEALNDADTVVFDKTGTLTRGIFSVTAIVPAPGRDAGSGLTEAELLYYAASAESGSNHPIAQSIVRHYGKEIDSRNIQSCEEIAGKGIRVQIEGRTVLAGNARLMTDNGIGPGDEAAGLQAAGSVVHIAVDGTYSGYLVISDELKSDSRQAVADLKKAGIRRIVMLTGDNRAAAEKIGAELGLDEVYAELLPQGKVERLEALERASRGGKLIFVGDGINDAPVLARSDIGIAMGGVGSDAAIEAADIVLMTDEPSRIAGALAIARRTRAIVWQNIIFALGVKAVILVLGALGIATMWEAVFGDVGVALIAVGNAMRALRVKTNSEQP